MTLATLFATLNGRGLTLAVDGDSLRLKGSEAAVTPDIVEQLKEHKAALLAVLSPTASPASAFAPAGAPSPDGQEGGAGRLAVQAEARGEITAAETHQAVAEFRQLVQAGDYRDWRLEWVAELGGLLLHLRDSQDDDVRQRLLALAVHTPGSAAEWPALGTAIKNNEPINH